MEVSLFTPLIAFAAGLLSCVSPCVLPLVPAYVGNLSGVAAGQPMSAASRARVMTHSVAFVLGFMLVFITLGASVGFVGYAVRDQQDLMRKFGGLFMIAMGMHTAGVIRLPFLERTFASGSDATAVALHNVGYARSVGLGSAMAAGWTPCLGPTLGAILTLAAASGTAWTATGLLLAYAAGLAVPFLLAGFAIDRAQSIMRRLRPVMPFVTIASGVILMLAGVLLYTNALARFNRYFQFTGPGANL